MKIAINIENFYIKLKHW